MESLPPVARPKPTRLPALCRAGAALKHFEETGSKYPLVVKLGTITPHGADVYSYAPDEDDMVTDPLLKEHLAHWGINMMQMDKTAKTMAEMEVSRAPLRLPCGSVGCICGVARFTASRFRKTAQELRDGAASAGRAPSQSCQTHRDITSWAAPQLWAALAWCMAVCGSVAPWMYRRSSVMVCTTQPPAMTPHAPRAPCTWAGPQLGC